MSYDTAEYVAEILEHKNGHPLMWDTFPKNERVTEALAYLDHIRAPWKEGSSQEKMTKAKAMDKQQTWFPSGLFTPQELQTLKKRDKALSQETITPEETQEE